MFEKSERSLCNILNPFYVTGFFLYSLKTSEKLPGDVERVQRNGLRHYKLQGKNRPSPFSCKSQSRKFGRMNWQFYREIDVADSRHLSGNIEK